MAQYRIEGREEGSNRRVELTVDADSVAAADRVARGRGVTPIRIEIDEDPLGPHAHNRQEAAAPGRAGVVGMDVAEEREIWTGTPSQWSNFPWFVACILLIPIPIAIWKALVVATTRYTLTTQRLRLRRGVFSRVFDEIEVYRIKDSTVRQSLVQRFVGLGTIDLVTSDRTHPTFTLTHVKGFEEVQSMIRTQTEAVRKSRGVREIDME